MLGKLRLRGGVPRVLFVLGLALFTVGCGSKGTVSGKVYFRGQPLTGGSVTFVPEGGTGPVSSSIGLDGSYTVTKVPPGPVKIAVFLPVTESQSKRPKNLPADVPEQAAKMFASRESGGKRSPEESKFSDPNKSGITYNVISGKQNFDIDLK